MFSPLAGPAPVTSQSPVPCKLCILDRDLGAMLEGEVFPLLPGSCTVPEPHPHPLEALGCGGRPPRALHKSGFTQRGWGQG